ncbi:hypothetical protein CGJ07_16725 [Vibrio parahaemolyticus]|nr:hypothetical protein CGJ07_16725 [Vibrio parahaemolyticus]TON80809.1 hypothetical protein CGH49_17045 [Vibrio parahaemolyticus]
MLHVNLPITFVLILLLLLIESNKKATIFCGGFFKIRTQLLLTTHRIEELIIRLRHCQLID